MAAIDQATPTPRQTRHSSAPFLIRPCGLPSIRYPAPAPSRVRSSIVATGRSNSRSYSTPKPVSNLQVRVMCRISTRSVMLSGSGA